MSSDLENDNVKSGDEPNSDEFGFVTPLEFLFEKVGSFCHTRVFPLFQRTAYAS